MHYFFMFSYCKIYLDPPKFKKNHFNFFLSDNSIRKHITNHNKNNLLIYLLPGTYLHKVGILLSNILLLKTETALFHDNFAFSIHCGFILTFGLCQGLCTLFQTLPVPILACQQLNINYIGLNIYGSICICSVGGLKRQCHKICWRFFHESNLLLLVPGKKAEYFLEIILFS